MASNPSFIVVFKDGVTKDQINKYVNEVNNNGGKVTHRYESLNGFAANIPESFLTSFRADADGLIKYVEPNGVVTTQK